MPKPKGAAASFGITQPKFWDDFKVPVVGVAKRVKESSPSGAPSPADEEVNQMLVENPGISGSTLLNLIRSKGLRIVGETDKVAADGKTGSPKEEAGGASESTGNAAAVGARVEADTSSANPGVLCARESWVFRSQLIESSASDNGIGPTRFRVVLLQEGLGNLRDGYYYSKEALKSAVPVFEGKKIYADHPSADEERTRPERSVRDVLGHFENCTYQEASDGTGQLIADACMLPDLPFAWARALMRQAADFAKKFPDKELVGLSINANGDATPYHVQDFVREATVPDSARLKITRAIEGGLTQVKVVNRITEAVSCDLVTEAGAGGKVLNVLESGASSPAKPKEEKKMPKKKLQENEAAKEAESKEAAEAMVPEHKDEAQDKELIKAMLDKHLGSEEHSEETMGQAKEAIEAAVSEGMSREEAEAMAGSAMKCSRIMRKKAEAAKAAQEAKAKESQEAAAKESAAAPEKTETVLNEADKDAEILKLKAENATLREAQAKAELEKYVDQKLAESKLPRETTKKFREACGEFKSKNDFDTKLKVWVTAREAISGEAESVGGFVLPEKAPAVQSGEALDLSDCVK